MHPIQIQTTPPAAEKVTTMHGLIVRGPRPMHPAILARDLGADRIEILVVGHDGAVLDGLVVEVLEQLARFSAVMERPLEAWPVGHPDAPSGYLVSGLTLAEVPRILTTVGRGALLWRGAVGTILEGRWSAS